MSAPWWIMPDGLSRRAHLRPDDGVQPQLVNRAIRAHLRELSGRAASFVREWSRGDEDAGDALIRSFGSQLQPLLARVNRLPEKTFVEFLRLAGIEQLPGGTAAALLSFEATSGAPESAYVPPNFQVGAQPPDDSQDLVVFETKRAVYVTPGEIAQAAVQQGRALIWIEDPTGTESFRPFGDRAIAGRAFLIGIDSTVAPGPSLSLGFVVASAGIPSPVSTGGVQSAAIPISPVLQWEALDGGSFAPIEVILDETSGFKTSGIVELQPPRPWEPGTPSGAPEDTILYWIRVRIVHGSYDEAPELSRVMLNAARAEAAETIRHETLEHVGRTNDRMRVSRTPVIPLSLIVEIEEGSATGDLLDPESDEAESELAVAGAQRWTEVSYLSDYGPGDRVFTLDPLSGELTFGDGRHGKALPSGFRHVRAVSYRVGGGARGAVDADEITTLIHSAPFLSGATNPLPASGGMDMESRDRAILRGPEEIRARGRAVTERDYELLACRAPGASVARAHAVSGFHPLLSGASIPGVVGVFVVAAGFTEGPPVPDDQTLRAVAEYLAEEVAPAGVEVVAAAPRFHSIRAEISVQIADPAADVGETVRSVISELNAYFDPIVGGDDGTGWPFGASVRYMPLLRQLLERVPSASAIPRVNLVVDGARFPACTDAPISAHGLLWSDSHEVMVESAESSS